MGILIKALRELHQHFAQQLFYPLVLSSLLAGSLFLARALYTQHLEFRNLVWNLALAWVPYLISFWASSFFHLAPRLRWLLLAPGAVWLIFFPNAPYLVTDFLYLRPRPGVPMWFDIILLVTFAWTGLLLAAASLRMMHGLVRTQMGPWLGWIFVGMALGLGGWGIYLGRFSRFNSWDLILDPAAVFVDLASRLVHPLGNPGFFGFTLLFSMFLLVVYLAFVSVHQVKDSENRKELS